MFTNPFKRNLSAHPPAQRSRTASACELRPREDRAAELHRLVVSRLARRYRLSQPHADLVADLAGLGPNQEGRR